MGPRSNAARLDAADAALKADLAAEAAAKKQRSPIDELEDKLMTNTAGAAAASGTPEQAKDMLAKARAKAMQAAADGADTGALDAMVWQMQQLAEVAEENRLAKKPGGTTAAPARFRFLPPQAQGKSRA
jgi:hypothetical protein